MGRRGLRTSALSAALLFAVLAVLVRLGLTAEVDLAILRALQSLANPTLDLVANLHTIAGLAITTVAAALGLCVVLWRRGHGVWSLAPLAIVVTAAIELPLKMVTGHPSPGAEFDRTFIETVGPRFQTPSSFPSGHAARISFLLVFAMLAFPGAILRAAAVAFIGLTLWARVYIGNHWPTDVLGGFALGIAVAVLAARWLRR